MMKQQFQRGDIVEVQDVHYPGHTYHGIYIAHDPTNSNPHVVHVIGRTKYPHARFNQCRLVNNSPIDIERD